MRLFILPIDVHRSDVRRTHSVYIKGSHNLYYTAYYYPLNYSSHYFLHANGTDK